MKYLAKNETIISEVQNQSASLQRGQVLGVGGKGITQSVITSLGKIHSEFQNRDVWLALKEKEGLSIFGGIDDIGIISSMYDSVPQLRSILPSFYGVVHDNNGKTIGMFMEDVSENLKHKVYQISKYNEKYRHYGELLTNFIENVFKRKLNEHELDDLYHSLFSIDSKCKILDIDGLHGFGTFEQISKNLKHYEKRIGTMEPYILKIDGL